MKKFVFYISNHVIILSPLYNIMCKWVWNTQLWFLSTCYHSFCYSFVKSCISIGCFMSPCRSFHFCFLLFAISVLLSGRTLDFLHDWFISRTFLIMHCKITQKERKYIALFNLIIPSTLFIRWTLPIRYLGECLLKMTIHVLLLLNFFQNCI